MRMHKGARRIAMGRNLEDASEGQTTLSATRAFKKLYHARSMPSLARQQFPSSATATRATRALTQPHTHTHTAQNHMEKEYLTNGRNCWIDRTRRRRLGTASPWSLKRKFTDLKDSVLDLSKRFWYCPNSSAIRLYSQMWVAYNTTSAEIWQPENNGTEASRLKHSSQFVRGSFTRAASWHTQKNWIWRVVR